MKEIELQLFLWDYTTGVERDVDHLIQIRAVANLTDEQIQEHAETMRLKAIKFLTEARLEVKR